MAGKAIVLAWNFANGWRACGKGKHLAYTLAFSTIILAAKVWPIGAHSASPRPNGPEKGR